MTPLSSLPRCVHAVCGKVCEDVSTLYHTTCHTCFSCNKRAFESPENFWCFIAAVGKDDLQDDNDEEEQLGTLTSIDEEVDEIACPSQPPGIFADNEIAVTRTAKKHQMNRQTGPPSAQRNKRTSNPLLHFQDRATGQYWWPNKFLQRFEYCIHCQRWLHLRLKVDGGWDVWHCDGKGDHHCSSYKPEDVESITFRTLGVQGRR